MSYILEALKKSEQERRRGEVPEINRFDATAPENAYRRSIWPWVVIALVIVNLAVLVVWAPWESPEQATPVPLADEAAPALPQPETTVQRNESAPEPELPRKDTVRVAPAKLPEVAPRAPVKPPEEARRVSQPVAQPEPEIIRPRTQRESQPAPEPEPEIIRPAASPQTSYLPQLQELPADMQRRVPDMSFSSHMYSSEPRFRSIIINGRRLKEGQYLNDDIRVREITEKGVILSLDGTDFEVDVLGQWVN